ncbi:CHAT domain-containing protein [Aulosira sp. FACHB-615]|uniref:CHAT domain-containing protein n=1 Tax=Aulosira sp. FACHB-615 TaxID=2692777 RepID=UPI001684E297|nr:CHAT domain-containing protein [Aulosira sp. FACHB-615]MBD2491983.1 CHAT domain-containing protein [Aulosira sp. FACHB-615]
MHDQYIFSGSLPENASTYVKRQADDELYEALLQGKFCYVLNSRQSGKSSLRVRTMSRLSEAGIECAAIDLSSISIQTATQENWYADLIVKLIDSFVLDVDFKSWWEQNNVNSPLLRFSNFLTKILLTEISENIVIFVDEIDSVLSLNFPTDDFFAFIRSCYNLRVDNPEYNRLTFCLLGVASPTSLIQDKNRTPFNIGQAISLKGFQLHEVEPLEKGLYEKFSNPQAIMQEILQWTGGQPFLTQKLCQFMVEESEQDSPRLLEQVVRSRILESWESQDEPEHLRTIQARILRDEQRAGYLLELYQQVRVAEEQAQVIADETLEQSELQLSGLVVRQQGKLRIYNHIYREIFNSNWIETQLNNLRPYSDNFRFWVASGGTDDSRLLREKALQEAEKWASDKNLSYQDKQFLAASKEKEIQEGIAAKEQEAALEREKKDREAAEHRNKVLSEANKKAQRRISIGTIVLISTLLITSILAFVAGKEILKARDAREEAKTAEQEIHRLSLLSKLGGELYNNNNDLEAKQIWEQASLSLTITNTQLKQAILLNNMSIAYQQLGNLTKANKTISDSFNLLNFPVEKNDSATRLAILAQTFSIKGRLLQLQGDIQGALSAHTEAFNILQSLNNDFTNINPAIQVSFENTLERVYLGFIQYLFEYPETGSNPQNLKKILKINKYFKIAELNNFFGKAYLDNKYLKDKLEQTEEIDPETAIIYPFIFANKFQVIVKIHNKPLQHYTTNITKAEVDRVFLDLRKTFVNPAATGILKIQSQKLYSWLLRPIESQLSESKVKTLIFVPNGALRNLPIAALYDGKKYLVEKYTIALSFGLEPQNPKSLVRQQLRVLIAGLTKPPLGFANFAPLPAIKSESNLIASAGVSTTNLLDQAFTSKELEKNVNTVPFNVLHLATHCQFNYHAENTFILAADGPINVTKFNNLLRSRNESRSGALELLVLSACQTAVGDNAALVGLAGAAVRSGARSTLASLWQIDDESTALFVGEFYRQLRSGITTAEAVRKAQLKLLQHPNYKAPSFWASYVLLGL